MQRVLCLYLFLVTCTCLAKADDAIKDEGLSETERLEKHADNTKKVVPTEEEEKSARFKDCVDVKKSGKTKSGVYTITPPGSKPMEVYCDMTTDGGGWVVFQRRQDGSVNFDRSFADYTKGFGDKKREFWLGNTALKTLTATGKIDLRIDMWDWSSQHKYATYTNFQITGDNFVLSFDKDSYKGDAGDSLFYHYGMGFTTKGHDVDESTGGNCAWWLHGGWWFKNCHRSNLNGVYKNQRTPKGQRDQGIQWTSWKGSYYSLAWTEMKLRARQTPKYCTDLLKSGTKTSGKYTTELPGMGSVDMYCDMETDGGGWTVFQRRQNGRVSFERTFKEYTQGFGSVTDEFWLGLNALKTMTDHKFGKFELRVDMWDWDNIHKYAKYQDFAITSFDFSLKIGYYSGDAGDSLSNHNRMGFSTKDNDVDNSNGNCAAWLYSGWWFNKCHQANLNGRYKIKLDAVNGQRDQGIQWTSWKGFNYSLKKAEMKFRPIT